MPRGQMLNRVSSLKMPAFNTRRSTIQDKMHAHKGHADEEFLALTAKEMFETVDSDKDGKIDRTEFEHLHKVLTVRPSPPPVDRPLRERDHQLAVLHAPVPATHRAFELGLVADRLAARTEQRHVGGRSVEALVHCGDPRCDELDLTPMVVPTDNTESHGTAFTVSVDLTAGTTTGISASDRAATMSGRPSPFTSPTASP